MPKFIYWIVLLLIIIISTSCKLKFREDNDFFIPAYRIEKKDNVTVETSLHKRYFVENYGYNAAEFDTAALNIICRAINDSIPLTYLDFTFIDGINDIFYDDIAEYIWTIETPDKIKVIQTALPSYRYKVIPFGCEISEKYRKKE